MIQWVQFGSVPFKTFAARTASISCGRQGFMIADVMPAPMTMGMKPALMPWRCGRPNEMFEAPQVVFTPSSSRRRRTRVKTCCPADPMAPTGITSGSTTMSCAGMPKSAARTSTVQADCRESRPPRAIVFQSANRVVLLPAVPAEFQRVKP